MISIEGMDHAIVGTGIGASGEEVLVYDGRLFERVLSVDSVIENLSDNGYSDVTPLFVYLDEDIGAEVASSNNGRVYH